jgi:hypothetical protein
MRMSLTRSENRGHFHFLHSVFSLQLKSRVGNILVKTTVLRITLNLDGTPITSNSHSHPSYSQTSRLYVTIRTRVRDTSETVVGDVEVHHQRHRVRRVRVNPSLDRPTVLTCRR